LYKNDKQIQNSWNFVQKQKDKNIIADEDSIRFRSIETNGFNGLTD